MRRENPPEFREGSSCSARQLKNGGGLEGACPSKPPCFSPMSPLLERNERENRFQFRPAPLLLAGHRLRRALSPGARPRPLSASTALTVVHTATRPAAALAV